MSSIVRMERRGRGLKREEGPSYFHLDAGMGKLARTCTYLFCHLFIPFFFFMGKRKKQLCSLPRLESVKIVQRY